MSTPAHLQRPAPHTSEFNRPIVEEFRANGGRVGGMFEGGDLLLLTTEGARSGREHLTPLAHLTIEDQLLVVASAAGSPRHPDWYTNVLARPMVTVELGTESFAAVAVPLEGAERDRLFAEITRRQPGFADYQERAGRTLPVVALQRSHTAEVDGTAAGFASKLIEIHTWLRTQLRHVRTQTDAHFAARGAGGEQTPVSLDLQIRQHCLAFCQALQFHHTGEDVVVLPDLERQFPDLAEPIRRLRQEHVVVARIKAELEALLESMTSADPVRFRRELDRMSEELTAHLDYEESVLIPALSSLSPPPEPA